MSHEYLELFFTDNNKKREIADPVGYCTNPNGVTAWVYNMNKKNPREQNLKFLF